jgi:hypothetical protein
MSVRTAILAFASTVRCCGSVLQAQRNESLYARVIPDTEASYANSTVDWTPAIGNETFTDPSGAPSPQGGATTGGTPPVAPVSDNQWHIAVSPFLLQYLRGITYITVGSGFGEGTSGNCAVVC